MKVDLTKREILVLVIMLAFMKDYRAADTLVAMSEEAKQLEDKLTLELTKE